MAATITVTTNEGEITRKATWKKDGVYVNVKGAQVRVYSENGKWYTQDYEPVVAPVVEAPAKKEARQVTILVRYLIKQDCKERGLHRGDVVMLVENGEGKQYYVTLRINKVHSCECDGYVKSHGRNKCYHIASCVSQHNARIATNRAKRSLARFFEVLATLPVGCEIAPAEESNVVQIASHRKYTGAEGNLNTGNEFSLLKKAV